MKTSELTGELLDRYVAKALGAYRGPYQMVNNGQPEKDCLIFPGGFPIRATTGDFRPSTDWSHGGPIIERERIGTTPDVRPGFGWLAGVCAEDRSRIASGFGPTPLIAAMRAYVELKLGARVDEEPA